MQGLGLDCLGDITDQGLDFRGNDRAPRKGCSRRPTIRTRTPPVAKGRDSGASDACSSAVEAEFEIISWAQNGHGAGCGTGRNHSAIARPY